VTINSFRRYAEAIEALFDRHARYAVAVKQQSAYWRVQRFEEVSDGAAEKAFDAAGNGADRVGEDDRKQLEDWAWHRCIQLAIEHDLPIKIHTGYNAGHDCMNLAHVRPADLTSLFVRYPKARFDLFHIGYPYEGETLALAKHFSNVYVDLCWTWIIDPQASRRFLKQFLTAVPANKLFGFGGDHIVAEPVYGHLQLARDAIAGVLSELVAERYFTVDQAIRIAQRILRDNALAIFNVDAKKIDQDGRDALTGGTLFEPEPQSRRPVPHQDRTR
jgi:predicted TIM-barrel fold metal-dependent hydrolase